jgi:hypothetical protein
MTKSKGEVGVGGPIQLSWSSSWEALPANIYILGETTREYIGASWSWANSAI